jgi:catechol 2,3-dioxygenase-like lactoylglutathione lyase family enzyme
MYSTILNITLDCADAAAQARFWAAATGGSASEQRSAGGQPEYAVTLPGAGQPRLYFSTVPEPKAGKNRLHLDLIPPDGDQAAELARLTRLGASVAAGQPPGVSWVVLADPEGNEFCLEG